MFASTVTADCCQLFVVERTDKATGDKLQLLGYAPTDYITSVRRADYYQATFDPLRTKWDYRVSMCS